MNTEQVFQLVDRILPFEACLFHQVLPLSLSDGKLHLGMVMLDDVAALEYARRLAGYQNYILAPQSLSSEVHHKTLTAYLNYSQNPPKPEPAQQKPLTAPEESNLHEKDTLAIETPDELEWQTSPTLEYPLQDCSTTETEILEEAFSSSQAQSSLPTLRISTRYANEPIALLTQLPPPRLLQELLGRVLGEGIGRLYFERQAKHGRILWSQNGTLQASMDMVPLPKFQAVLDQLKELTHLPLTPVTKTQQVEIERSHQRERVLLRLQILPIATGEQATLQVLRGAALKFHQRQQSVNLSRDALAIVQKLQTRMDELHHQTNAVSLSAINQFQPDMIPVLNQMLQMVEQQLTDLKQMRDPHSRES